MFVRVKTTPNSPRKSVQIVQSVRKGEKVSQKIVRYVGIAMNDYELDKLKQLAEAIKIRLENPGQEFIFPPEELAKLRSKQETINVTEQDYKVNLKNLKEEKRVINGIHDVYGKLFDELGYVRIFKNPARNKSSIEIFKHLVLARIANPKSKMASLDMLEEEFAVTLNLDYVYKSMDKIDDESIEKLNKITFNNTSSLFKEKINVMFFDCTTIYFESFKEDDFKKNGYSKDCKFGQPQILVAFLVTTDGLALGYRIFKGNMYEGKTMIPVLEKIKKDHKLNKVVLVADSGMLNKENIEKIEKEFKEELKIEFIMGARLKNLDKEIQHKILDRSNYKKMEDGRMVAKYRYKDKDLIVTYSETRAKKDAHDREKAIKGLMAKIKGNKNIKSIISNYGYKKYLQMEGTTKLRIDKEKIKKDSQWDGLHGVITNTESLTEKEVMDQYRGLWQIEESFRITKHDLKVRPIFHWKERRIKAHLAICFTAFSLIRYLEYRIKLQYKKLSPERIRKSLIQMQTSILYDKEKKILYGLPSKSSLESNKIYRILKIKKHSTPYIIKKM